MHFTEYDTRLAAYVLLTDERRVLLTWFRGDELNPPCWTLPGGGIEFDESLRDAAIRETYEETGYHVSVQRILADSYETAPATSDSRPFRSQRFLYAGTITGGMLAPPRPTVPRSSHAGCRSPSSMSWSHAELSSTWPSTCS